MSILGNPQGVFDLHNSDKYVGSYFQRKDILEILNISNEDLSNLKFENKNGVEVIDERKLQKAWYNNEIPNAKYVKRTSLDELVLVGIIRQTFPECEIERQLKIGRFSMDFKLTLNNQNVFIEFDGPSHFAVSRFGAPKHELFRKKKIIEDKTGVEVVNWAYWIQRCTSNVRVLFDKTASGLGVLWSTNIHFGDFIFDNSSEIITTISKRFNAIDNNGIGYFYEENTKDRNNVEHPIIGKILKNKENKQRLLPKGYKNENFWLPSKLNTL